MVARDPLLLATDSIVDRVCNAAARIGNPQNRIGPYIHVAGVSGKTSVAVIAAELLAHVGPRPLRVGLMTYPPPPDAPAGDLCVCLSVGGSAVLRESYEAAVKRAKECSDAAEGVLTAYEAHVLGALDVFASAQCDIVVVECALGGRFDATRVLVPSGGLALLAITTVAKDHERHIGKSLADMFASFLELHDGLKAPIVLQDAPDSEACAVAMQVSSKLGISTLCIQTSKDVLSAVGESQSTLLLPKEMAHGHRANIDMALAIVHAVAPRLQDGLCYSVPRGALASLNTVAGRPSEFSIDGRTIIVDAAQNSASPLFSHRALNPQLYQTNAVQPLTDADGSQFSLMRCDFARIGEQRVHWVLGLSGAKSAMQHSRFLKAIGCSDCYRFSFVRIETPPDRPWIMAADPRELQHSVIERCQTCGIEPNVTHYRTIAEALADKNSSEIVVVTGSPHVVADFFALFA